LLDLLLSEVLPSNDIGLLRLEFSHCYFLGSSVIKLDALQFMSELQALGEGVLLGLQNLVADVVAEASEKELMLEEFPHICHNFSLGFGGGGSGFPDGSHGGGLAINETFVGGLDPDMIVIDCFSRLLS
jgi:hypothetical protein